VDQRESHKRILGTPYSPNRVLALLILTIITVAIVITIFSSTKSVATLDPKSPQGRVQAYLSAVYAGRNNEAAKFFAPTSGCKTSDLAHAYLTNNLQVLLVKTAIDGANAQVWISVEMPSSGPFGSSSTEDHTLRLIHSSGQWLLADIPWPLYNCEVITK
jgi:hypothetical protein